MVLRKPESLYSFIMAIACIFQGTIDARKHWNICSEKSLSSHSVCIHLSSVLYEVERRTQYIKDLEMMNARMGFFEEDTNAKVIESIEQNINGRMESLKQNINARMESIEQNTNARMESLEGSLHRRMKWLEQNMNARMEFLEKNRYEIVESFDGNVNARMEGLAVKMNKRMKSLDEKMNSIMELQEKTSNVIPGPKMLTSLNQTWYDIESKMKNVTSLEEKPGMQKLVNSKFEIIEESMNRDRSNTKKLKERLDSVESDLSNLTHSLPVSQMSENIGSFQKALKSINETIHENIHSEKSRQSLLEMNSRKLQELESVKAQVGFLRIANSVAQRALEELRNKIENVENILERGQHHRRETRKSDKDDSKEDGSAGEQSFRSAELGTSDKPDDYSEDGFADLPSFRSEELGSSDKPDDYSEGDDSDDNPSFRSGELGSSDKPSDSSEDGSAELPIYF